MSTPFTKTAIAALAISFAGSAFAADKANDGLFNKKTNFSYNYIEANLTHYNQSHMNGLDLAKGSFAILPNLSIIGSLGLAHGKQKTHFAHITNDRQVATVGASYQSPLAGTSLGNTDYVLHAELEHTRFKTKTKYRHPLSGSKTVKDDDTGFIVGAGLRHQLIKNLEVFTDLSLRFHSMTMHASSMPEGRIQPFATVGARYSVIPNLQVGGSLEVAADDAISANVRYSF